MRKGILIAMAVVLSVSVIASSHVTRQEAHDAVFEAEDTVVEVMEIKNRTERFNDSLDEARLMLRRATHAAYLRNDSNGTRARQAREALAGLDVEDYQYSDVLEHTGEIHRLRDRVFNLTDRLQATRARIAELQDQGLNTSEAEQRLAAAEEAYRQEQYEDVDASLVEANSDLDRRLSDRSVTDLLAATGAGVLQQYGREIALGTVGVVAVLLTFSYLYWRHRSNKRFEDLKQRLAAIERLMEETQEKYYVDEELSKSVYKARMETYRTRKSETEEELASLADRLGREPP